jgi:hypothetical protein
MYIFSFLILHEFIQIRIALAISLLLLSSLLYIKGRVGKSFFIFIFAILVHVSSIIFVLAFYFSLICEKKRGLVFLLFPIPIIVLTNFTDILNQLIFILPDYVYEKLFIYIYKNTNEYQNESVNVLSFRMLVLYLTILLLFIKISKISKLDFIYLFCVLSLTIFAVTLRSIPDIAFRIIDISIFFSIFLIQSLHKYYVKLIYYLVFLIFIISSIYYNFRLLTYAGVGFG